MDPSASAAETIKTRISASPRLSYEAGAWPLNVDSFLGLRPAMPGAIRANQSGLVAKIHSVDTLIEISVHRQAAWIAGAVMQAGINPACHKASEQEIAAALCSAMIPAVSDLSGSGVLSPGERANQLQGYNGKRALERDDLVLIEVIPNAHNDHARFVRPIIVGTTSVEHYRIPDRLIACQDTGPETVQPGEPVAVAVEHLPRRQLVGRCVGNLHKLDLLLSRSDIGADGQRGSPCRAWIQMTVRIRHGLSYLCSFAWPRLFRNARTNGDRPRSTDQFPETVFGHWGRQQAVLAN